MKPEGTQLSDANSEATPANGQGVPAGPAANCSGDAMMDLLALLENDSQASVIFESVVERAVTLPDVTAAAVFTVHELKEEDEELRIRAEQGTPSLPEPPLPQSEPTGRFIIRQKRPDRGQSKPFIYRYFALSCGGKRVGWLGLRTTDELPPDVLNAALELSHIAAVTFERLRSSAQLRHYMGKLEVLNELNKLVASGTGLERIMKTIAREAAFRFTADCSLAMYLSEDGESLEIKGSYGTPPRQLPTSVPLHDTQVGRVLRLGGIMSVPDLALRNDYGLEFLTAFGITCVHCAIVETHGHTLGAIAIGYRNEMYLDEHDGAMLEEFARGASVAIVNAKNQAKLTSYTNKLEELVEARTADLAIQTARADEANRAKSDFVANMSHELRTPLTAIVGYSSVIADGVFGIVNEQQKEGLVAVTKAAEHLKELIDDVLDVSKIEAGKAEAEPTEVELLPLLTQVFKLMLQTAINKGISLIPLPNYDEQAPESLARLWVDSRHIRQVLINMMSNAVKYTPTGGSVALSFELVGDKARINIKDTGIGISVAQQQKLFERYQRLDDSYARAQTGTGIGLSLTKHLVEINGGLMGVEGEVGKGSTFWIMVPLSDDIAHTTTQEPRDSTFEEIPMSRLDGLNVLVVDDSHLTCDVLKAIISAAGGNPYVAHSVREAKEIARTASLDTALIDLAMPGESGVALLEFFRKECVAPLSTMPLIVVSACVFDKDRAQALQSGASLFVAKPFRPAEMVKTIRDVTTASVINSRSKF